MIIDMHAHAWPDKAAEKARIFLERSFRSPVPVVPSVDNLLRSMDRAGIDRSCIAAVASRPDQVESINRWLSTVTGERLMAFGAMHPAYPHMSDELKRLGEFCIGIKLQPEFQEFAVDDPQVFPLYEAARELGLPILFHCGEELSGTMMVRSAPQQMLRVITQFPGLKVICAHFGGFNMWDEVEQRLIGTDAWLDTAFTIGRLDPGQFHRMACAHAPDKILFGTDFPLTDPAVELAALREATLPAGLHERILSQNFLALVPSCRP